MAAEACSALPLPRTFPFPYPWALKLAKQPYLSVFRRRREMRGEAAALDPEALAAARSQGDLQGTVRMHLSSPRSKAKQLQIAVLGLRRTVLHGLEACRSW